MNWPRCSSSRPLPPRPVTSYFVGADGLLGAAAGLDGQQVAVAGRRDEAEHAVLVGCSLIRMTPLPGPGQEVHLVDLAQHGRAPRRSRRSAISLPVDLRDADDLGALGRPRVAAAGARARLDERRRGRSAGCSRRSSPPRRAPAAASPSFFGVDVAGVTRGSRLSAATTRLAVLELEQPLDRLAVAGRRRHVDDAARVGHAEVA